MMYTNLYFQINKWTTIGMEVHLSADDVNFIRDCMKEQHTNNYDNTKMNNTDNHACGNVVIGIIY